MTNNIFSENRAAQVYVNTDSVANGGHTFSHNLYYKPKTAMLNTRKGKATSCREATHNFSSWTSASKDKKSLAADPKFRNPPSDFRLRSASPAINAGGSGGRHGRLHLGNAGGDAEGRDRLALALCAARPPRRRVIFSLLLLRRR